jgi:hypothetical protein
MIGQSRNFTPIPKKTNDMLPATIKCLMFRPAASKVHKKGQQSLPKLKVYRQPCASDASRSPDSACICMLRPCVWVHVLNKVWPPVQDGPWTTRYTSLERLMTDVLLRLG